MLAAIGEFLPLALGTALSPLPLIAIVFLVLSANGTGRSVGFMAGRLLGIAVMLTVLTFAAEAMPETRETTVLGGLIKILLGLGLVYVAVRKWRKRPQGETEPPMPGWVAGLDTISTPRAFGLGLLVTAINPKELAFTLGAAISIGAAHQQPGAIVVLGLLYVFIAGTTVLAPVLMHLVAPERAQSILGSAQRWLLRHQSTVVGVVLLVLGVVLVSDGLTYL
ncbi:GAP family protein [Paeniglutamicibacter sp. NPDC012692]|uniref:GAP family protein n=1 Tax=Paeniglutamicibacter sp. NPDC012692 TaxID=3364388 RepID=UPI00367A6218